MPLGHGVDIEEELASLDLIIALSPLRFEALLINAVVAGILLTLLRPRIIVVAVAKGRVALVIFLDSAHDLLIDRFLKLLSRFQYPLCIGIFGLDIGKHTWIFLVLHVEVRIDTLCT